MRKKSVLPGDITIEPSTSRLTTGPSVPIRLLWACTRLRGHITTQRGIGKSINAILAVNRERQHREKSSGSMDSADLSFKTGQPLNGNGLFRLRSDSVCVQVRYE